MRLGATCILLLTLLGGCCAKDDKQIFEFNIALAKNVFGPMARGYRRVVPAPIRKGLRNVTDNLRYTDVMVNNLLQGKVERAFSDAGRITINWICFAGLFDAATDIGIPKYDEDFGQTLGVHGFGPGPYFNVPFLGPTTLRDVTQHPFRLVTSPFTYLDATTVSLPLSVSTYFFQRFDDVEDLGPVLEAVDPYAFVQKAYLDRREFLIHDGDPPRREAQEEKAIDEALEDLDSEGLDDLEDLEAPAAPDAARPEASPLPPPRIVRRARGR